MNAQQLSIAIGTVFVYFSTVSFAYADSFKIGGVKEQFPIDTICVSFSPNQTKAILVSPFPEESEPVIAWMNIDGQDIQLKQVSLRVSGDKSVAEYQSKDALVTVKYKIFPEQETKAGGRQETSESIAINYKGQLKTINTTGECTW
jgi:hypothetical protein